MTKRALASVEPRSDKRRRGRQQAVAVSDDLFIGTDSERADGDGCPSAGCEGHVDVPEPEHCALEGVPVDQAAVGLKRQITFVKGDATRPILDTGHSVVAHVCNDVGTFGAGFAGSVARRWKAAQDAYFRWHRQGEASGFRAGAVQMVPLGPYLEVANMISMQGVMSESGDSPL